MTKISGLFLYRIDRRWIKTRKIKEWFLNQWSFLEPFQFIVMHPFTWVIFSHFRMFLFIKLTNKMLGLNSPLRWSLQSPPHFPEPLLRTKVWKMSESGKDKKIEWWFISQWYFVTRKSKIQYLQFIIHTFFNYTKS